MNEQELTNLLFTMQTQIDDLTAQLDELRVKGLNDLVSGTGNQQYGGGVMQLGNYGGQIKVGSTTLRPGWYWLNNISATPSSETYKAVISGYAVNDAVSQQASLALGALAGNATFFDAQQAYVELLSDDQSNYATATLASRWVNTAGKSAEVQCYSSNTADGAIVLITGRLRLWGRTTDPSALLDGELWFRTDLFRPRIYSNGITGNLAIEIQSTTAPAVANNGTITTAGVSVARVAPAGAVTGVILAVGTTGGQVCTVVNESVAASTVTFAASGTSNVADGVASVIAGLTARTFVWDSSTALWYPTK